MGGSVASVTISRNPQVTPVSKDMAPKSHKGPVIIVEIGNDWLKMAQAEPHRRGASFSRIHLEKFSSAGRTLSQSISKVFKEQKFARGPVIACLPRQMVNIRILDLPSIEAGEIEDMIDLQVGKQTPYSKDEIVSDYRIIGSGREGYTKIMLVIVQRSVVREHFYILEEAGIEVEKMTVSSEGLLNWYAHTVSSDGGARVLLDIDSFYTDCMVISDGGVMFTRSILVGANHLLSDYENSREKLSKEVKRSLEIFLGESPGLSVDKLLITGAGPNITGLDNYLSGQLDLPCEPIDCLSSMEKLPKQPSVRDPAYRPVSLTSLVGIALAPSNLKFDLIPDTVRLRKGLMTTAKSLTAFGMLVMTVLVSASAYAIVGVYFKKHRLADLQEQIRTIETAARKVVQMKDIIIAVKHRGDQRFAVINLLATIHPQVPESVKFTAMNIRADDNVVRLTGLSQSRADVSKLVKRLQKTNILKDVKVEGRIDRDPTSGTYNFVVVCVIDKEKNDSR